MSTRNITSLSSFLNGCYAMLLLWAHHCSDINDLYDGRPLAALWKFSSYTKFNYKCQSTV